MKKIRTLKFFQIRKSQANVKDFPQFPLTAINLEYYTCTREVITSRWAANSLIEFRHSSYHISQGLSFTIFAHWPILMQNFPSFFGILPVSTHFNIFVEASSTSKKTKTGTCWSKIRVHVSWALLLYPTSSIFFGNPLLTSQIWKNKIKFLQHLVQFNLREKIKYKNSMHQVS